MKPRDIVSSALEAIGDTPLLWLARLVPDGAADVLVKLESGNPTGSYKDRMALALIEGAQRRGELHPGRRVVECTGGSTGSSLAFIRAVKGYPLSIVTSDAFSPEKLRTMRAFGAELTVVPSDAGRITPELFDRMRAEVDRIVVRDGALWTDQFRNTDALTGYARMGREIVEQTRAEGVDAFCAGVGTGGMLAGVTAGFRAAGLAPRVIALEPASSPMLTAGHGGPHGVEGIGTGRPLPLLDSSSYHEVRAFDEARARDLAVPLARREGVFAGTSSALNVVAAIDLARELGPGHTVVTIAVDTGLKYLSGGVFGD
ncbi:PLP-dependent cysteine synthase family protein [Amycolatopsis sp. FDAARGOS 1241]|uniref:PLP-dependent cysteine synthase family protein n=1 Tax=Amycolatopsis sp. FDAARGOS 1241 TaxID=2778070 RepID=UPI0019510DB2|nr:cysteine synthase family protein [Amycolatopsis sp. FDAARGOS 1241]QRP50236.1 cysteine synthase family protein [Amycolatopsis sp. FDAARGOS 1241]